MEELRSMKEQFISAVQGELAKGINQVNTYEMGQVIDIIKDLSEAIYYCSVAKAMDDSSQTEKDYYIDKYIPNTGRMYFSGSKSDWNSNEPDDVHYFIDKIHEMVGKLDDDERVMVKQKLISMANMIA